MNKKKNEDDNDDGWATRMDRHVSEREREREREGDIEKRKRYREERSLYTFEK